MCEGQSIKLVPMIWIEPVGDDDVVVNRIAPNLHKMMKKSRCTVH